MRIFSTIFGWLIALLFQVLFAPAQTVFAQEADPAAVELIASLSLRESAEPIRTHPRWARPRKVVVSFRGGPEISQEGFLAGLRSVAGDAQVFLLDGNSADFDSFADADVLLSFCRASVLNRFDELRWHHSYSVGVDSCLSDPAVRARNFIMTNNQRVSAPSISEAAIGMVLMLSRDLQLLQEAQYRQHWRRGEAKPASDIAGKTMLILGLGGIGTETARRASALGMRVVATRNSSREGPDFVAEVGLSGEMYRFAAEADYIVNA